MANYYNEHTILYLNGEYVKANEAKMDLYSQSLHYGYSVFEGIRSYKTAAGETKIFKPLEHFERLKASAQALNLPYTYDTEDLIAITYEVLKLNNLQDAYIRPVIFAPANMSFTPNIESFIFIEVWPMQPFLGEKLLRVMTSSFERPNPKGFKIQAKAAGHYVNSILASQEAKAQGFDEALLNDISGFVAEGPGANMFFEKDGKLFTPATGNILPGITRSTLLKLARDGGYKVEERPFTLTEAHAAKEVFVSGTTTFVKPIVQIDDRPIANGAPGTVALDLRARYRNYVDTVDPATAWNL